MLSIQSINLMAGTKVLLEGASLSINSGQKIGLIGQNGAGKSTLLKAILNEVSLDSGNIAIPDSWLVGVVQQELKATSQTILDFVVAGDSQYAEILAGINRAEQTNQHDMLVKYYDKLDQISGYLVPQKAQQLMYGLGFSETDFIKPMTDFSGGWQVRLKLAKALMQRADILLLDEPTNHLDIEAVSWLIQWLKSFEGAVIVISHDRFFLDEVVDGIASIADNKITYYAGNFAAYERQRNEQLMQQQSLHDKQKQQVQHLKSFIERFKAKASKAKQAQSRVKALERMETVAAVQATNPFKFKFYETGAVPDPMLQVESIAFGYDDSSIIDHADLVLRAGDRIGLVGVNGSGKSTLLKLLIKELSPQSGKVILSKGVRVGYFAQHQLESLNLEQSPLQHMLAMAKSQNFYGIQDFVSDQEARNFLGGFGFSHEKTLEKVATFSGGEKARLSLALMIFQKPNLIVLDEPTNHLDMETRDALDIALQEFEGALILVTHDQHLLSSIVDQFWWLHDKKVTYFNGSLEDYLQQRLKILKEQQSKIKAGKKAGEPIAGNKKEQRQENAQLRKQLREATKQQNKELKKIEQELESAQKKLTLCHSQMEDSSLYEAENSTKLTKILKEESILKQQVETLEESWLLLEEEIELITERA
ncbi:MAG TPA: ABC transporter [Thiomicrospira sp.]|nr:ABC transporter [Thiomicrospira sp.]